MLMVFTIVLSVISYKYVEKKVSECLKQEKGRRSILGITAVFALLNIGAAFYINSISRVVRDVPELDTYVGKTTDRMHITYNEAPYKMNKDFSEEEKLHWLVIGNSYGRDWVNVLKEMELDDVVELSYIVDNVHGYDEYISRIADADLIFRTMGPEASQSVVDDAMTLVDRYHIDPDKIRIVSNKRFGYSAGQVYSHRNDKDYYLLTMKIDRQYYIDNSKLKKYLGSRYIDLITLVTVEDCSV